MNHIMDITLNLKTENPVENKTEVPNHGSQRTLIWMLWSTTQSTERNSQRANNRVRRDEKTSEQISPRISKLNTLSRKKRHTIKGLHFLWFQPRKIAFLSKKYHIMKQYPQHIKYLSIILQKSLKTCTFLLRYVTFVQNCTCILSTILLKW